MFQFLWGGETLLVNARFRELHPGGRSALFHYVGLAAARNPARDAVPLALLVRMRE